MAKKAKALTAAEEYSRKTAIVRARLVQVSDLMKKHAERFEATGRTNYGMVGDLGRLNELLDEAFSALGMHGHGQ